MLSWPELQKATLGLGPAPATLEARREALRFTTSPTGSARGTLSKHAVLSGVAASSGAAGTAVVVHDPTADTDAGDILVAHDRHRGHHCSSARPPSSPTPAAYSSHTSIVTCDFGIPAVVGTGDATTVIHTGDEAHVDGDVGRVEIIHRRRRRNT